MSKIEMVKHLDSTGPQLQIVQSIREMQHEMQSLPEAIATETSKALEPLVNLQEQVRQALEAYDQITATQRSSIDALATEMKEVATARFNQIADSQGKIIKALQIATDTLTTAMQDHTQTVSEMRSMQSELTGAYQQTVKAAQELASQKLRVWKVLVSIVLSSLLSAGAVLAGQLALSAHQQQSAAQVATLKKEAQWAQNVWAHATPADKKVLQTLAK